MYDYVAVLIFDEETNIKIISLKSKSEIYGAKLIEKLPPHITIDLYENIGADNLIMTIDKFISEIHSFPFQFIKFDNFNNNILFLKPNNEEEFVKIKNLFDLYLKDFIIKNNPNEGIYKPHSTLISGGDITNAQEYLQNQFSVFEGKVTQLCVFSNDKKLIRKYDLN